jgi:hypothetical protein
MEKRTWHYILPPSVYDMTCNTCGGSNLWWSEYEHHIWCYDCEVDFIADDPHAGVFGGFIPIHTSYMLGLVFDRFNLETGKVELFNLDEGKWDAIESIDALKAKSLLIGNKRDDPYGFNLPEEGGKSIKCGLYDLVREIRSKYK